MRIHATIETLLRSRGGNFATGLACLLPVLLGGLGGAIDLLVHHNHVSELQATADAAVLAAAGEAGLKGWNEATAKEIAAAVISSSLSNRFSGATFEHEVRVSKETRQIEVSLRQDHYGYFVVGYFMGSPQIEVRSQARASGQAMICVIVQSGSESKAFEMTGGSTLLATGCSAYSNSVSKDGIAIKDKSVLTTQLACSGGGFSGPASGFVPLPVTDCPYLKDPLAVRGATASASISSAVCDHKKTEIKSEKGAILPIERKLSPGVYCGDLKISGKVIATFNPGIYVIKDGRFRVEGGAIIRGERVGFMFVGEKSGLEWKNDTGVFLSAPVAGPLAGILAYAPALAASGGKAPKARTFKIESKDAQKLEGTVYLPGDPLVIGGDADGDGLCDAEILDDGTIIPAVLGLLCEADVGAAASWTAIVARKLKVTAGATLVLNSDYANSDVPVPQGLGHRSGVVSLAQ